MHFTRKIPLLLQIGFGCAVVLHIVIFLLLHVNSSRLVDEEPVHPYVKYISTDSPSSDVELEEYAMLFDSAPLFISTIWNASQSLEIEFEDATLNQFSEFEPQIDVLNELRPSSLLIMDDFQVDEPLDLLASRFWYFFTDFGDSKTPVIPFEEASPLAEVSVMDGLDRQLMRIPMSLETTTLFSVSRPAVYHIRVFGNGLSSSAPTLVQTSGSDAFDQSVAEWIHRPEVLMQLPEGYLEMRVFYW